MNNPVSTYRLQFHKDFTFSDFEKIISYLKQLGVGTIYASPIFEAVPGSTHGYDGLNPHRINPEIGTLEQLKNIRNHLQTNEIGWLQDIVPNHMAFDYRNQWLMDVLEKGQQSNYASFFDIDWNTPLMVPFLSALLQDVIKNKELKLEWTGSQFVFKYYDAAYPLRPSSYIKIFEANENIPDTIQQWMEQVKKIEEEKKLAEQWNELKSQLEKIPDIKSFIENCLQQINNADSLLQQIAEEQFYRLCYWQETNHRINYRRFFTVNGLICLNIQDEHVFDVYHELVRQLVEENIFTGLRIDHIDGLYDPTTYLERLRKLAGDETYITVEKILEPGEHLPNWPIQGNTGYDFLSLVNNLFTQKNSEEAFTKFYRHLVKEKLSVRQQIHNKKAFILYNHMTGELENLYQLFRQLNLVDKKIFASIRAEEMKEAIGEFLIECPVYRYYGNALPLQEEEAKAVQEIFNRIRKSDSEIDRAINILEDVLLKKPLEGNAERNERTLQFYQRCMQFAGPLMAKGVEDTLMYTYNRFIDHNEVGDSPESFGISVDEFHRSMIERQQRWPLSMNTTSTHDTKRGEDVRARLNVLTDLPEDWFQHVKEWQELNKDLKQNNAPDTNDEYLIYQTLIGAYPMPHQDEDNFQNRIQEYLQKALREAKTHSNWTTPNEEYEAATKKFAASLFNKRKKFWKSFEKLHQQVAEHGIINSLSQVLLKFTCPGIPDVYQGCELWDLSLVDPDNRRLVDYKKREEWLNELLNNENENLFQQLWEERFNGKIKLWLLHQLFELRKQQPVLFSSGEYIPLKVEGSYSNHVFAFARKHRQTVYVMAVPLHTASLCKKQNKSFFEIDWKDTKIFFPEGTTSEWLDVFADEKEEHRNSFSPNELFKQFPVCILKGHQISNERGAGILLHITSLPSAFGIGDFGVEAKVFADFLNRSHQKYWQMLPLNPVEEGQGYSPYSSISSRAGNILLISPEALAKDGLLDENELISHHLPQQGFTNYAEAAKVKNELFAKAWQSYKDGEAQHLNSDFESFKQKEKEWLDDFALYSLLKQINNGKPWYEWNDELKQRDENALQQLASQHEDEIEKIKWLQFIFSKQWKELKQHCNNLNIQLIGDLPFYISYDSVDVWSHKEIFAIDENGNRIGMAGVPPDAFSADGQLWGMPVFNWDVLKEKNYDWWIERLRKNIELFDIIRLDHFRAFSAYWEVPAGEQTAKNGSWKQGPGQEFFNLVQEEFGELPFVVEDLGEIDEPVYQLRDEFHLPGMKVLQFAFGGDMPRSVHIPHNYEKNFVVYTGTHDNNTTRGWFTQEASEEAKLALEKYVGRALSSAEISLVLSRMAYSSVARIAILPLQDVLNLDEKARMNKPSSAENNWSWRLIPGQINGVAENNLRNWTWLFNRE